MKLMKSTTWMFLYVGLIPAVVESGDLGVSGTITAEALTVSSLDCTASANGGTLTTDANGVLTCSDDHDSAGAGGVITADAGSVLIEGRGGLEVDTGNVSQMPGDPVLTGSLGIGDTPRVE